MKNNLQLVAMNTKTKSNSFFAINMQRNVLI